MTNQENTEGNMPEKRFSTGSVTATVWQNQGTKKSGESVSFRTVSFQRRYRDKEGNWQSTSTLRINDLQREALVLQQAYEFLVLKEAQNPNIESQVEEVVM